MRVTVSRSAWVWKDPALEHLIGTLLAIHIGDDRLAELINQLAESRGIHDNSACNRVIFELANEIASNRLLQNALADLIARQFPPRWMRYGIEDAVVDVLIDKAPADFAAYASAAGDANLAYVKSGLQQAMSDLDAALQLARVFLIALLRHGKNAKKEV